MMKRYFWVLLMILFSSCQKKEPQELKDYLFKFPPAEIEPDLAQLNPELNFFRIQLGSQTRIAFAYLPDREVKFKASPQERIRLFFGVIPLYFARYKELVHLQVLAKDEAQESLLWSDTVFPDKNPSWKSREFTLKDGFSTLIIRSDIKDYGLVITPPQVLKEKPDSRPSIIFILIDALRADHLGIYGYPRNTSPYLDELARSGVFFNNVMTSSSFTVTSLTSIFTSQYPWEHRVLFPYSLILNPDLILLAQNLKSAGYQTAGFSATYFRLSDFQLDRGFELFDEACDSRFFLADAQCLNERVFQWLETEAQPPFFLYLHYVSPHSPYLPPPEYQKLFSEGIVRPKGRVALGDIQPFGDNRKWYQIPRAPRKNELDWLISQYDGEIRYVDTEIGKLLNKLSEMGLKDKTLLLVTADHGEAFFEHRKMDHTEENHWQVARIPLILSGPGIPPGKKIDALIRSIDFAPFLLEYAQANSLPSMSGKSLTPLFEGMEQEPRLGFSLMMHTKKKYQIGLVKYPYHFLLWRPADKKMELYDLEQDPAEQNNLVLSKPELVKQLISLLPEKMVVFSGSSDVKSLSPDAQQRLKTLGYTK